MNLATRLSAGYAQALDHTALALADGSAWTYRDLENRAAALAGALRDRGVSPGDRVLTQTSKSPDVIALYLATLRIGAIYLPLNTAYTPAEVDFFRQDAQPKISVDDETLAELVESDAEPFEAVIERAPSDGAAMLYTSGTTGRSKGALLSHRALIANGEALNSIWGFSPSDVLIHILPVFHVHGLFVALHCAMLSGATIRFEPRFDVDRVIDALGTSSVLMGVPTHYGRLLSSPRLGHDACGAMRLFTSGSAPLTAADHAAFLDRTGHTILERYGMTEAGIITSNPLQGERVGGTVGFALPGVDLRLQEAEIQVRGPHLFEGYWNLPDKTAEAFTADGWFRTGDLGAIDADGRVTLHARASDMIISGGYNIYPSEIERVLDQLDGVAQSAVIGVPHPDFGEGVVAVIARSKTNQWDQAMVQAALEAELARFKHPKHFVMVDELPRNAMGKVQKAELRANYRNVLTGVES